MSMELLLIIVVLVVLLAAEDTGVAVAATGEGTLLLAALRALRRSVAATKRADVKTLVGGVAMGLIGNLLPQSLPARAIEP